MQSFCPVGKSVVSVTVYQSDYGKEQMERESKYGIQGIWKKTTTSSKVNQKNKKISKQDSKSQHQNHNNKLTNNDDNDSDEDNDEVSDSKSNNEENDEDDNHEGNDDEDDDNPHTKDKKFKGDFIRPKGHIGVIMQNDIDEEEEEEDVSIELNIQ